MSANFARISLYHMLSAVERDLRNSIDIYVSGADSIAQILSPEIFQKVSSRARNEGATESDFSQLSGVLDFLDFGDLIQVARRNLANFPLEFQESLRKNHLDIENLSDVRNRVMHSRPLEYDDLPRTLDLVQELLKNKAAWPSLSHALEDISTRPETLLSINIPIVQENGGATNNLPIPDFDETGFIGRKSSLKQLKSAITGVFPVVTVVGEGGLGKTSLAIKAAYDILDESPKLFDAIIFVSAKTAQLTTNEIKRIDGAINSSLGLIESAVGALSGQTDSPVTDLLQLLSDFKVLLILDNLETVIDDNVKALVMGLPPGSKLVITSRIGLGAYEFPITLTGLTTVEATQLLRSFSKIRGVEKLTQMRTERLAAFCEKMRNNPLHIKWFVSAVHVGKRPEEVLSDERLFLRFCLSNVYEQLSVEARSVVRTLLSVGGANSTAELAYLSELDEIATLRAIQELMRTNMFIATSSPTRTSFETKYELSALSRSYLSRFYPVKKDEQDRLISSKRQLVSTGEHLIGESRRNPLSPFVVHCRSRSDSVVAKHLSDALRSMRAKDTTAALESVERAKALSPDFYEVYRVEAWIFAQSGSISDAYEAYERAIELEPDAAHLHMFFGGFLLISAQDTEAALPHFKKAMDLLPSHMEPVIEAARCSLYLKDFDEALRLLKSIENNVDLGERLIRKTRDLRMQIHQREAEHFMSAIEPINALRSLESLREYCSNIDYFDDRMRRRINMTRSTASAVGAIFREDRELARRVEEYLAWVGDFEGRADYSELTGVRKEWVDAVFLRLHSSGKFGFAQLIDGDEIFIHSSQLRDGVTMASLLPGDRLHLSIGIDVLGRTRAENVTRA